MFEKKVEEERGREKQQLNHIEKKFFERKFFVFSVFIDFVTILFLSCVLVFWPPGMWNLSSPTRNQTCTPSIGR